MSVARADAWRRPGCDDRCWWAVVLIVGDQQTRGIACHDADAHEDYIREALGGASPKSWRGAVQLGPLRVDFRSATVSVLSMPITDLTRKQWGVLLYLTTNAGRLIPRDELIEAVWGREYLGGKDAFLRVTVSQLRRKLWEAGPLIEVVRKRGYRLRLELPCT